MNSPVKAWADFYKSTGEIVMEGHYYFVGDRKDDQDKHFYPVSDLESQPVLITAPVDLDEKKKRAVTYILSRNKEFPLACEAIEEMAGALGIEL